MGMVGRHDFERNRFHFTGWLRGNGLAIFEVHIVEVTESVGNRHSLCDLTRKKCLIFVCRIRRGTLTFVGALLSNEHGLWNILRAMSLSIQPRANLFALAEFYFVQLGFSRRTLSYGGYVPRICQIVVVEYSAL